MTNHGSDALQEEETPLHWAARYGNFIEAKFMLQRGAHLTARNNVRVLHAVVVVIAG